MIILDNLTAIAIVWAIVTVIAVVWISFCCNKKDDQSLTCSQYQYILLINFRKLVKSHPCFSPVALYGRRWIGNKSEDRVRGLLPTK